MSNPYVKDTQIWVPTGPSDWVKGEVISLDSEALKIDPESQYLSSTSRRYHVHLR